MSPKKNAFSILISSRARIEACVYVAPCNEATYTGWRQATGELSINSTKSHLPMRLVKSETQRSTIMLSRIMCDLIDDVNYRAWAAKQWYGSKSVNDVSDRYALLSCYILVLNLQSNLTYFITPPCIRWDIISALFPLVFRRFCNLIHRKPKLQELTCQAHTPWKRTFNVFYCKRKQKRIDGVKEYS